MENADLMLLAKVCRHFLHRTKYNLERRKSKSVKMMSNQNRTRTMHCYDCHANIGLIIEPSWETTNGDKMFLFHLGGGR